MYDELSQSASSIEEFNRLIVSWQKLADKNQWGFHDTTKEAGQDREISKVNSQANDALLSFVKQSGGGKNGLIDPRMENFPGNIILVDENSKVLDLNQKASRSTMLSKNEKIKSDDFVFNDSDDLNDIINTVACGTDSADQVVFKQIEMGVGERQSLLAIVHSRVNDQETEEKGHQNGRVMLMVIDVPWNSSASDLVAGNFGLTDTEVAIVDAFVTGVSLKQIALNRGRSYATIRNQFQSILEKTNSAGQTELLRMLLSVSYLFAQTNAREAKTKQQCGKSLEIMRPNGRSVDVLLCGDLSGFPVISIPSIFGHPMTPEIDQKFKKAGLCFVGIAQPGYGKSSLPTGEQSRFECYCGDVKSVIASLEADRCTVVGRASAAPWVFQLTTALKLHCSNFVVVNSLVPRKFVSEGSMVSKWTNSLMSAARLSNGVSTLILGSGQKLLTSLGAAKFIPKMYSNVESDVAAAKDEHVANSIETGARMSTAQGLDSAVEDMTDGFLDWSNVVVNAAQKVKLFQGELDPHVPIQSAYAMAKEYPEQVEVVEVKTGGGLLSYSHNEVLISLFTNSCDFEEHARSRHRKEPNL